MPAPARCCVLLWVLLLACNGRAAAASWDDSACTITLTFRNGTRPSFVEALQLTTDFAAAGAGRGDAWWAAWVKGLDSWVEEGSEAAAAAAARVQSHTRTLRCRSGGGTYSLLFRDPRMEPEEGTDGGRLGRSAASRSVGHHFFVAPCAWFAATAPRGRPPCDVDGQPVAGAAAEAGRAAAALQGDAGIGHTVIQRVGPPEDVNNLVLLAAGYLASERAKFEKDAADVTKLFKFPPKQYKGSVPFYRYFDVVNVFSVYQPSRQQGATDPTKGITIDDNLGCTYGRERATYLFCDLQRVLALAETSPAKPKSQHRGNTVVTVLVNSQKYGGGGTFSGGGLTKVGVFYTGLNLEDEGEKQKYASLLFHELGHAWGDLADEYDTGVAEPSVKKQLNCVAPGQPIPWQAWIDKSKAEPALDIDQSPTAPCGFSNYLKPSQSCIMSKLSADRMCPVCREAVTKQMYATKFSLLWPTCPLPDEIVHMPPGSTITLHANSKLLSKGDFKVTWRQAGNVVAQDAFFLQVAADALPAGTSVVELTVEDATPWVLDRGSVATMKQTREFTLKRVPVLNNSTGSLISAKCWCTDENGYNCRGGPSFFQQAPGQLGTEPSYAAECKPGGNCSLDFSTTKYETNDGFSEEEALKEYESYILYVCVGAGVSALMLWVIAWRRWRKKMQKKVQSIFSVEFKKRYVVIRGIMMGSAVIMMLASFGTYVLAVYLYTQIDGIGKWLLVPGCIIALVLYVIAFVGFWAACLRSKCFLAVNGVLLLLCVGICITAAYYAKWFHDSICEQPPVGFGETPQPCPQSDAQDFLRDIWETLVADHTQKACTLQRKLECSGWTENCQRPSTLHCPDNCETTNAKYPMSCRRSVEEKIIDKYFPSVFAYSIVLGCLLFVGVIFNFLLCYAVREMEKEMKNKKEEKHALSEKRRASTYLGAGHDSSVHSLGGGAGGQEETTDLLRDLTLEERRLLRREFRRYDKEGKGLVSQEQYKKFLKKAMGARPSDEETSSLFRACGATEEGDRINFYDVLDSLAKDDDELRHNADVDAYFGQAGGAGSGGEYLMRDTKQETLRSYLRGACAGEDVPEHYADSELLSPEERHRRHKLRQMYVAGVRYGADPSGCRSHYVNVERELGMDYDTRGAQVYVVAVDPGGAADVAEVRPGDVLLSADGCPMSGAGTLAACVAGARARGQTSVLLVTKQPFPTSFHQAPQRGVTPLPGRDPPSWVGEMLRLQVGFVAGGLGVRSDNTSRVGTHVSSSAANVVKKEDPAVAWAATPTSPPLDSFTPRSNAAVKFSNLPSAIDTSGYAPNPLVASPRAEISPASHYPHNPFPHNDKQPASFSGGGRYVPHRQLV
eukprot:Rhum_TRINITY_DN22974_c0_g1::Rhum_TRINITY_DN22974_c0_g1_i1::g.176734::m.176734